MGNHDLFWLDLIEIGQCSNRFAGEIHESGGD
ncbi:Uncharacterised protein [Vibrio cholerae]|nr:Uncharacterised protein [Vibrio cholerae]